MHQHKRQNQANRLQGAAVEQDRRSGVCPTGEHVLGVDLGSEGNGGHQEQHQQVVNHDAPVDAGGESEQIVVVEPQRSDDEKAHKVSGERRPLRTQLGCQRLRGLGIDVKVDYEQGDRHGHDAVADRLDPVLLHPRPFYDQQTLKVQLGGGQVEDEFVESLYGPLTSAPPVGRYLWRSKPISHLSSR